MIWKTLTKALLAVCLLSSAHAATVYNYFAPTQAGAGSSCAANQIWFLNSAGTLVACSSTFTWDNNGTFTVSAPHTTQTRFINSAGTSGARNAYFGLYDQGGSALIEFAPATDAGVISTTDFFAVISGPVTGTSPQLQGLQYVDTSSCAGTGEGWSLANGDMQVQATNCAPAITVQDLGTGATAAAVIAALSTAGNGALTCAPNNNQFSGGIATNACYLGTGLFNSGAGNIPLVFGTNHVYAGRIGNVSQGLIWGSPTGTDEGAGTGNFAGGVFDNGVRIKTVLTGTTGSIGGSLLAAGACSSGTVSITGAVAGMAIDATPNTYPGDGTYMAPPTVSSGVVTVRICAAVAGTPTASTYNVRVLQ